LGTLRSTTTGFGRRRRGAAGQARHGVGHTGRGLLAGELGRRRRRGFRLLRGPTATWAPPRATPLPVPPAIAGSALRPKRRAQEGDEGDGGHGQQGDHQEVGEFGAKAQRTGQRRDAQDGGQAGRWGASTSAWHRRLPQWRPRRPAQRRPVAPACCLRRGWRAWRAGCRGPVRAGMSRCMPLDLEGPASRLASEMEGTAAAAKATTTAPISQFFIA
jgi:hypothetical protein